MIEFDGGCILTETHKIELKKLTKKHKIFKKINTFLLYYAILLFILMLIESFGIIDLPFYEQSLPFSHRIFLNTWVGIPYIFIEKKMKKIDNRIRQIESMYERKFSKTTKDKFTNTGDGSVC